LANQLKQILSIFHAAVTAQCSDKQTLTPETRFWL